jgi:SAM-dependent methyltransferase
MQPFDQYAITGGVDGRERLRLLARVMRPSTEALFDRLGLRDGLQCLDVGCGGGDVTLQLARRVAPSGKVVGTDIDPVTLELARREAAEHGVTNVEFRQADIRNVSGPAEHDLVYTRFVLTHLSDPAAAVQSFHSRLRPGGIVAVEDVDFRGHFTYPESNALDRYLDLYCAVVTRRGGDPNIGARLPSLLQSCGFVDVDVAVAQPVALQSEAKLLNPLTMERIAEAVLEDGLETRAEIDELVRKLYAFAADPTTLAGAPRVVQASGRRPT